MTMSTLMCPHCGGRLLIDPTLRLQSMLTCPYCARKSLMQKKNGMIVLRGIIASSAHNAGSVANTTSVEPVPEPAVTPEVEQSVEPEAEPSIEPEAEMPVELETEQPFEPEPVELETEQPFEPEPVELETEQPFEPEPVELEAEQPFEPEPVELEAEQSLEPEAEKPVEPDAGRSIDPTVGQEPVPVVEKIAPLAEPESRQEHLIALATRAADEGSIMAFNSYARQAIDCDPTDPRMYVLRSRLIEQAHGFARATFLSPVWMSYTPRQKAFVIAQHFSSFNAAIHYSAEPDKTGLAAETGRLIAWQIREAIIENARLRLGKRPFNGKFHRQDLGTAPRIVDSLRSVNETVVPQVADELLRSIRGELDKLDPKLYYQLLRSGF